MSVDLTWDNFVHGLQMVAEWFFTGNASLQLPGWHGTMDAPPFVLLVCIVLFIKSIRWAARDAKTRGKSGFVAGLFIIIAVWPLSVFFWRWLRPPPLVPPAYPAPLLPKGTGEGPVPPLAPAPVANPFTMS